MSRYNEFHDAAGRKYVETDMPKDYQYKHKLSSFGEPRRLEVYHPEDKTPRKVTRGYVSDVPEGKRGKKGLIGYMDFYREPTDYHSGSTNIGFMNVHDKFKGGGVSRQMVEYLDKTTPEKGQVNFGEIHHIAAAKVASDMEKANPGRFRSKGLWYFKEKLDAQKEQGK